MFLMRCAVCYHLYNLRNLKSTLGGVLLLVKLQTKSCCKKPAPKNFAIFTKKHHACNFIEKRLQHRCFPVNIAKFLRTPILK